MIVRMDNNYKQCRKSIMLITNINASDGVVIDVTVRSNVNFITIVDKLYLILTQFEYMYAKDDSIARSNDANYKCYNSSYSSNSCNSNNYNNMKLVKLLVLTLIMHDIKVKVISIIMQS